jgi:hypothetical protein
VLKRAYASAGRFVEADGWALDESVRHTMEAFRIAVAAFAWSNLIGRAVGIATATSPTASGSLSRAAPRISTPSSGTPAPMDM